MKKNILLLLLPIVGLAQSGNVGIGTTSPTNTLHVKSLNQYILRIEDVTNTDNNNFIITAKDALGTFQKTQADIFRSPLVVALPISTSNIVYNTANPYQKTTVSISLPNGRWAVSGTFLIKCLAPTTDNTNPTTYTTEATFADTASSIIPSADIEGNTKGSTSGNGIFKGVLSTPEKYNIQTGIIILNNSTLSSKTYYLIVKSLKNGNASNCNLVNYGASVEKENQLYALPLID